MTAEAKLQALLAKHPYIDVDLHSMYEQLQQARASVLAHEDTAEDQVDRIIQEMEVEQQMLAAAFGRFSHGKQELRKEDVKNMSEYLGFPSSDDDVSTLILAIDTDRTGTVSFDEFISYVGHVGGSMKLFEVRRAQMKLAGRGSLRDHEGLRMDLKAAGIEDDAQAYWKLVVSPSEFVEAARLTDCQQKALAHIRRLSKANHDKALPSVQQKMARLGYKDDHLWLTLSWIREMAPIILHLDLDKMIQFLEKDTNYRNQFETNVSGGLLNIEVRKRWEKDLFGGTYDKAEPSERCKYGVLNVMNDYRGVVRCKQYGESYLVLKDARLRCTFSPEDSANLKADRLAVLDFYGHVLNEYSDDELKQTVEVANCKDAALLGDSEKVGHMKYKETQIHGEISFDRHVERLVAHVKHRNPGMEQRLRAVAEKFGWSFSWMDEEQDRMRKEEMHKLGNDAWKERLAHLQESVSDIEVQEGYCKKGCGRQVAPGVTRAGRPFTTCCRGCVMGFGHDLRCGQVDASKVGPGLCKNGCGKPVAKGRDAKGRPLDTCCRGCALGLAHDANCGSEVVKGMCKMDCGRPVAPGKTTSGKGFDTCCRNCARGSGHSDACIP